MQLFLIRHAEAVALGQNGVTDDERRPLTDAGRAQCGPLAGALRRLGVRLDLLLTSPLVRARQTAEGFCSAWGEAAPPVIECPHLAPDGKKRKVVAQVQAHPADAIGLVGHNPDLSELVGWLLGDKNVGINLEKAGVACVAFDGAPGKGKGTLSWVVNPAWCKAVAG